MHPGSIPLGSGEVRRRPVKCIIGIGGAGCNTISHMGSEGIAVCSDRKHSSLLRTERQVRLSEGQVRSARDIDPKFASALVLDWIEQLKQHLERPDIVFIFVGLGGNTGSYVAPLVAAACQKVSHLVVVSASVPFSVEGTDRRRAASEGLSRLRHSCDIPIVYSNDPLMALAPNLPVRKAFSVMDQIMLSPVNEMMDVITIDDIRGVREDFRGCSKARLGVGYGQGLERGPVAVADAFTSPWFDSPLEEARSAVVVLSAPEPDPYLLDQIIVDTCVRLPRAKVRYSSRTDSSLDRGIKVTILVGW